MSVFRPNTQSKDGYGKNFSCLKSIFEINQLNIYTLFNTFFLVKMSDKNVLEGIWKYSFKHALRFQSFFTQWALRLCPKNHYLFGLCLYKDLSTWLELWEKMTENSVCLNDSIFHSSLSILPNSTSLSNVVCKISRLFKKTQNTLCYTFRCH